MSNVDRGKCSICSGSVFTRLRESATVHYGCYRNGFHLQCAPCSGRGLPPARCNVCGSPSISSAYKSLVSPRDLNANQDPNARQGVMIYSFKYDGERKSKFERGIRSMNRPVFGVADTGSVETAPTDQADGGASEERAAGGRGPSSSGRAAGGRGPSSSGRAAGGRGPSSSGRAAGGSGPASSGRAAGGSGPASDSRAMIYSGSAIRQERSGRQQDTAEDEARSVRQRTRQTTPPTPPPTEQPIAHYSPTSPSYSPIPRRDSSDSSSDEALPQPAARGRGRATAVVQRRQSANLDIEQFMDQPGAPAPALVSVSLMRQAARNVRASFPNIQQLALEMHTGVLEPLRHWRGMDGFSYILCGINLRDGVAYAGAMNSVIELRDFLRRQFTPMWPRLVYGFSLLETSTEGPQLANIMATRFMQMEAIITATQYVLEQLNQGGNVFDYDTVAFDAIDRGMEVFNHDMLFGNRLPVIQDRERYVPTADQIRLSVTAMRIRLLYGFYAQFINPVAVNASPRLPFLLNFRDWQRSVDEAQRLLTDVQLLENIRDLDQELIETFSSSSLIGRPIRMGTNFNERQISGQILRLINPSLLEAYYIECFSRFHERNSQCYICLEHLYEEDEKIVLPYFCLQTTNLLTPNNLRVRIPRTFQIVHGMHLKCYMGECTGSDGQYHVRTEEDIIEEDNRRRAMQEAHDRNHLMPAPPSTMGLGKLPYNRCIVCRRDPTREPIAANRRGMSPHVLRYCLVIESSRLREAVGAADALEDEEDMADVADVGEAAADALEAEEGAAEAEEGAAADGGALIGVAVAEEVVDVEDGEVGPAEEGEIRWPDVPAVLPAPPPPPPDFQAVAAAFAENMRASTDAVAADARAATAETRAATTETRAAAEEVRAIVGEVRTALAESRAAEARNAAAAEELRTALAESRALEARNAAARAAEVRSAETRAAEARAEAERATEARARAERDASLAASEARAAALRAVAEATAEIRTATTAATEAANQARAAAESAMEARGAAAVIPEAPDRSVFTPSLPYVIGNVRRSAYISGPNYAADPYYRCGLCHGVIGVEHPVTIYAPCSHLYHEECIVGLSGSDVLEDRVPCPSCHGRLGYPRAPPAVEAAMEVTGVPPMTFETCPRFVRLDQATQERLRLIHALSQTPPSVPTFTLATPIARVPQMMRIPYVQFMWNMYKFAMARATKKRFVRDGSGLMEIVLTPEMIEADLAAFLDVAEAFFSLGEVNRSDMSEMRQFVDELQCEISQIDGTVLQLGPRLVDICSWVSSYMRDHDWQNDCVKGDWLWGTLFDPSSIPGFQTGPAAAGAASGFVPQGHGSGGGM